MKKNDILRRLWIKNFLIIFVIVILLIVVLIIGWQHAVIEYTFEQEKENIIENQENISNILLQVIFSAELSRGTEVLSDEQLENMLKSAFRDKEDSLLLFREDKLISGTCREEDSINSQLLKQKLSEDECLLRYSRTSDNHYIKAVSMMTLQGQEYRIITTTDISGLYQYEKIQIKRIWFICILLGSADAVFLLVLFFFLLKPLKKLNQAVKNAVSGKYNGQLKIRRKDEIGQIAENINKITQTANENMKSLREIVSQQESFIDNLSNEMRSPLASILGCSELILKKKEISKEELINYAGIILSEGRRLKQLSETLMDFLYIRKINEYDKMEISVKQAIDSICDGMAPIFQKKRVYFGKKIHDFRMRVDMELFQTMLYHYLDYAVSVSKEGGIVKITAYQTDMENIIEISNQSTAFEAQEHATERGGLEIALGQKIAAAHNGKVIILNKLHKGTIVRIIFQREKEIEVLKKSFIHEWRKRC